MLTDGSESDGSGSEMGSERLIAIDGIEGSPGMLGSPGRLTDGSESETSGRAMGSDSWKLMLGSDGNPGSDGRPGSDSDGNPQDTEGPFGDNRDSVCCYGPSVRVRLMFGRTSRAVRANER